MKERLKSLAFNLRLNGVILLKLDSLTFFLMKTKIYIFMHFYNIYLTSTQYIIKYHNEVQ